MNFILALGILLFVGYWGGKLIRKVKLPEVTGYIIAGVLIGPSCFRLIPVTFLENNLSPIIDIALGLIAFLIGASLNLERIKTLKKSIFWITFFQAIFAFALVSIVIITFAPFLVRIVGIETTNPYIEILPIAILLGTIASATAPGASIAVVEELKSRGPFTSTLLAIIALDDALAIILFGFCNAIVSSGEGMHAILMPIVEIAGSIALGIITGFTLRFCSKFLSSSSEFLVIVLGMVGITSGIAIYFGISPLLANMAMGFIIANSTRREQRFIVVLNNFTPPIYAAFFALSGTHLYLPVLAKVGIVGAAAILTRAVGKIMGVYTGGCIAHSHNNIKKYLGLALLPQAGVAIGLSLMVGQNPQFAPYRHIFINIVLASVVVNEIIGPPFTALALKRSGETRA
ncbi:cation:proton antiporter [candidate division WOR-3 bacterium]|nr:cation:proton antiporter [candidate division WOR-3 bacterium]